MRSPLHDNPYVMNLDDLWKTISGKLKAIIDAQFMPNSYTCPRKTSKADMTKALIDINNGKYIYKPE